MLLLLVSLGHSAPGAAPPGPRASWSLPWVLGATVGVEAGGAFFAPEPRALGGVSGTYRWANGVQLGGALVAGPPTVVDAPAATVDRQVLRAEAGWRGATLSAGLGHAGVFADGRLRGQLLYPVVGAALGLAVPVGNHLLLTPRVGADYTLADITFTRDDGSWSSGRIEASASLRAELRLPGRAP